jgi:heat shock protein HtpX
MKHFGRSLLILLALYGLVFAVGDLYLARKGASVWVAVAFAAGIVLLQYIFAPWVIGWFLKIQWDDARTQLPARNREFLQKICAERGLPVPRIGIIHGAMPNAFTFGRVRSDARLVVTSGLLEALTPEEVNAVLAHEVGHIVHWDFLVMMIASLVPLILYQLYAFTRGTRDKIWLAYSAYAAYWVSQLVVVALSRTREFYADHFSSEATNAPNDLASALVKICYGMVRLESENAHAAKYGDAKTKKAAMRQRGLAGAMGIMGISNAWSGSALALSGIDSASAAAAMRWDLVNPWARVYELRSTHPLTALRVRALNLLAIARGQSIEFPVPANLRLELGRFPFEVALWAAPWVTGAAMLASRYWRLWHPDMEGLAQLTPLLGSVMFATAISRIYYRYQGEFQTARIRALIEDTEVSEMLPRAVRLSGEIVGRGVPGSWCSPDLVIQDETGILFALYRPTIPILSFLYAGDAGEFIGTKVVLDGWYRRGARPYVEISRVTAEDGRTLSTNYRWTQYVWAALVCAGLFWLAQR